MKSTCCTFWWQRLEMNSVVLNLQEHRGEAPAWRAGALVFCTWDVWCPPVDASFTQLMIWTQRRRWRFFFLSLYHLLTAVFPRWCFEKISPAYAVVCFPPSMKLNEIALVLHYVEHNPSLSWDHMVLFPFLIVSPIFNWQWQHSADCPSNILTRAIYSFIHTKTLILLKNGTNIQSTKTKKIT